MEKDSIEYLLAQLEKKVADEIDNAYQKGYDDGLMEGEVLGFRRGGSDN